MFEQTVGDKKMWMALGAGSFKEIKLRLCHRLCREQPKVVKFCIIDHRHALKVRYLRSILDSSFRMHNSMLRLPASATLSTYLLNSFAEMVSRDQWEARRTDALSLLQSTQDAERLLCDSQMVRFFFFSLISFPPCVSANINESFRRVQSLSR